MIKCARCTGLVIFAVSLFLVFLFVSSGYSATYYVDATNGSDSRSGLSASLAWKSMSRVNSMKFSAGDKVLFKRGQSWAASLVPASSGSAGSPIVYGAYGTGFAPVIGTGNTIAVNVYNRNYITLQNLDLRATDRCVNIISDTSTTKYGITMDNNDMTSSAHGVYINASSGSYDTVTVTNNDITPGSTALWQNGIVFVRGVSNFIISNNTIGPAGEDAIQIYKSAHGTISGNIGGGNGENTIDVKNSHDVVISGNTCSNDGEANIVVHEIETDHTDKSYNILIEDNYCLTAGQGDRMNQGYRVYAGIYINYTKTSVVRWNRIERAYGSGIFIQDLASESNNNEIYGNVIISCNTGYLGSQAGIQIGDCVGTKAYNNTIYKMLGSGGHGISVSGGTHTTGIEVVNNIVHSCGGDTLRVLTAGKTDFVSDYNCFYPDGRKFYWDNANATSLASWQAKSGRDTHSMAKDALFNSASTGNFTLKSTSPAVDRGINVGLTEDMNGILIPQGKGPDMGAYER